jgi:hypothetical protein
MIHLNVCATAVADSFYKWASNEKASGPAMGMGPGSIPSSFSFALLSVPPLLVVLYLLTLCSLIDD